VSDHAAVAAAKIPIGPPRAVETAGGDAIGDALAEVGETLSARMLSRPKDACHIWAKPVQATPERVGSKLGYSHIVAQQLGDRHIALGLPTSATWARSFPRRI
jgi:hypothetical protein